MFRTTSPYKHPGGSKPKGENQAVARAWHWKGFVSSWSWFSWLYFDFDNFMFLPDNVWAQRGEWGLSILPEKANHQYLKLFNCKIHNFDHKMFFFYHKMFMITKCFWSSRMLIWSLFRFREKWSRARDREEAKRSKENAKEERKRSREVDMMMLFEEEPAICEEEPIFEEEAEGNEALGECDN